MNENIMYMDKETKEIFKEEDIRKLCYNSCLQDLECNREDIMSKSTNIDIIFENMKKSFNGTIEEIIQYANNDMGYSIEKWEKVKENLK